MFAKHSSERDCDPKYVIYKIASSPPSSDLRQAQDLHRYLSDVETANRHRKKYLTLLM